MIQVAFINDNKEATSSPVYQWDYGRWLHIYGIESLDAVIQVHFSDRSCDRTIVRLASSSGDYFKVPIPDGLLENSYSINAFIYSVTSDYGKTTHSITIPVVARKKPSGFISQPDESQTTLLEQALDNLNNAYEKIHKDIQNEAAELDSNYRATDDYLTEKYDKLHDEFQEGLEENNANVQNAIDSVNKIVKPYDTYSDYLPTLTQIGIKVSYTTIENETDENGLVHAVEKFHHGIYRTGEYIFILKHDEDDFHFPVNIAIPDLTKNYQVYHQIKSSSLTVFEFSVGWVEQDVYKTSFENLGYKLLEVWLVTPFTVS